MGAEVEIQGVLVYRPSGDRQVFQGTLAKQQYLLIEKHDRVYPCR